MTLHKRVEKLTRDHDLDKFDCGSDELNRYLQKYAFQNQRAGASQTYISLLGPVVTGYYTLVVGSVEYAVASERLKKGLAKHPVPVMILARLAVKREEQGKGIGRSLLKDAMLRTLNAAEIAGIRAMVVHAKDQQAKAFYEQFDFEQSNTNNLHRFMLLSDARQRLQ